MSNLNSIISEVVQEHQRQDKKHDDEYEPRDWEEFI
jgi:hypothetical protein